MRAQRSPATRPSPRQPCRPRSPIPTPCRLGRGQVHYPALPREGTEARSIREAKVRELCQACSVLAACRTWARRHREYGFWGGESDEERAAAGYPPERLMGTSPRPFQAKRVYVPGPSRPPQWKRIPTAR
ncbi:MAG: WhiB family transcriptional regulator [Actinomycetota bacterium]